MTWLVFRFPVISSVNLTFQDNVENSVVKIDLQGEHDVLMYSPFITFAKRNVLVVS